MGEVGEESGVVIISLGWSQISICPMRHDRVVTFEWRQPHNPSGIHKHSPFTINVPGVQFRVCLAPGQQPG